MNQVPSEDRPSSGLGPRWQQWQDEQARRNARPSGPPRRSWRRWWQEWQESQQRNRELEELGQKFYQWARRADIPPSDNNGRLGWELENKDFGMVGDWHQSWSVLYVTASGRLWEASDGGKHKARRDPDHVRRLMIQEWGAELD